MDTKLTNEDVIKRISASDNCYEENETEIWGGEPSWKGSGKTIWRKKTFEQSPTWWVGPSHRKKLAMLSRKMHSIVKVWSQEAGWFVLKDLQEWGQSGGWFLDCWPLFCGSPLTLTHDLLLTATIFYAHYAHLRDAQAEIQSQWSIWDDMTSHEQRKDGPHAWSSSRWVWQGTVQARPPLLLVPITTLEKGFWNPTSGSIIC